MTFVNFSLLAGTALITIPIVLHLIMRRKPKLLEFPALRFLQKRHDTNQRRLKLRHLLLLLLRAGAIALLAFALARPSMKWAHGIASQEAPVAAALVFDTSPHMQYRHENKTRLEAARELGLWLLAQLPKESQTAVLDTGLVQRGFDADRGVSKQRIERLDVVANSQPLVRVVGDAVRVLAQSSLAQKELYIFSDLSRAAWPADSAAALQDRLAELATVGVAIHVIDVGVDKPANFTLGEVQLSNQVLSGRGSLIARTQVSCLGPGGARAIELDMLDADGKPQKRRDQTVTLKPGEAQQIQFQVESLGTGTHQGFVRIMGQDGLAADDTRFFTVEVRPAWPILVVAAKPAQENAVYLTMALAPPEYVKRREARFDCPVISFEDLPRQSLAPYSAICLLDPPPLEPAVWQHMAEYTADGHGLAIFLGHNARPVDSFNVPAAQQVLPGTLLRQVPRPDGELYLAPYDYEHQILREFRPLATSTPWFAFPIFRYWELAEPQPGAGVILPYNDGRPAIWERSVGSGRVLTMTTPVSDRPTREAWNVLPVDAGVKPWPFMVLVNEMMSYLVGGSQQQLNYYAGQSVGLPLEEQGRRRTYLLTLPDGGKTPVPTEANQHELLINPTLTEQAGNYRLQAGGKGSGIDRGFSVNLAPPQTELQRVEEKQLQEMFGQFKFRLARTHDQIDRSVSMGRVGMELFPPLILVVAVVLAAEYVVANRFYRE